MDTTSKIRVRFGAIEVEYEGSADFLKDGLLELIQSIADMQEAMSPPAATDIAPHTETSATGESALAVSENQFQGSINTIASRLSVNSGPELVLAAMAHVTFVQGKETVTRNEILAEMKNATMYFKPSYTGNLSKALNSLTKSGQINELRRDAYALAAGARAQLEARLK